MKKLNTLYFPDTSIFSESQYPLFLMLDQLHYISPIERLESTVTNDIFIEQGFCQEHTPLPLGEDRDRFVQLVKDIRDRKDDYAAQLSALTIANMSNPKVSKTESRTEILSTLLGSTIISIDQEEEEAAKQGAIWQARLLLILGEILDKEEEELASHLSFWDDQEMEVFSKLQGEGTPEDENPFGDLLEIQHKMTTPNPAMVRNRCKAWQQMLGDNPFSELPIWTTTRQEAADYIFDEFEKQTGNSPYLCDKLSLPASIGRDMPDVTDSIAEFREKNSELLATISEKIAELTPVNGNSDLPERPVISPALEGQWNEALEESFPENLYGRKSLKFYYMQGFQPSAIIEGNKPSGSGMMIIFN